uniref:Succinate dehydrogenase subunit 6, mitochondrial n=3 Tax=Noccaea caerulescens TaxID=107243 RepID=A0A1J3CMI4_NOCCA
MGGESESFVGGYWNGFKDFWGERFSFFENYTRFTKRDAPLPSWSSSDVDEFIASDPVHGPTLKTAREAATFGVTGAALGAVSTAAFAWKYSRSPHGAALSFLGGGVFGWTFGQEVANHTLQLYKLDTMAAQVKFMEWWERKSQ